MTADTYRRNHGSGHSYTLDGKPKIKGVTTMMRGLGGPPESYFTELTAGYAVDHWDELSQIPPSERIKQIAGAAKRRFTGATIRGSRVHRLAESLIHGDEVAVPDDIKGHVEACCQFLDDYNVQPLLVEPALFSRTHQYAGSADFFATVTKPHEAGPVTVLGDYKTSASGPWGSMAFQLAGYRYADFYLDDDGEEQPVPDVDECWIVWLRGDGYDVYPMEVTPDIHRQLLYIDQCRIADEECRHYRGDPLPHPDTVHRLTLHEVSDD